MFYFDYWYTESNDKNSEQYASREYPYRKKVRGRTLLVTGRATQFLAESSALLFRSFALINRPGKLM